MQKVSNIIPYFRKELAGIFEDRELVSFAYLSIKYLLGYDLSDCIINSDKGITREVSDKLKEIIVDLKTKKPLQYILGEADFYGLKLKVNEHTLIPRPETEGLVDWILKEDFESALDIGSGNGCIAVSLAKYSNANVYTMDVSKNALKVAEENAILNNVKVTFIQQNILKTRILPKFDLIVSNPPYVVHSDKEEIDENVLNYEPHLALFVSDQDPLIFYRKIAELAFKSLNIKGKLFFEINERFGNEIVSILDQMGFVDIELKKDINDRDRMIKAICK